MRREAGCDQYAAAERQGNCEDGFPDTLYRRHALWCSTTECNVGGRAGGKGGWPVTKELQKATLLPTRTPLCRCPHTQLPAAAKPPEATQVTQSRPKLPHITPRNTTPPKAILSNSKPPKDAQSHPKPTNVLTTQCVVTIMQCVVTIM